MVTGRLISSAALMGLAAAYVAPRTPPVDDGFPNPNPQQLLSIEQKADGLLSNLPPPDSLSQAGITNFQLIAFNENLEVSFFDQIIKNITNYVPGFASHTTGYSQATLLEILDTVKAVSETALEHIPYERY